MLASASSRRWRAAAPLTRSEVTRRIMRAMKDRSFVEGFHVRREDGSIPILIALAADRVSDVVARINAQGGRSNVIVAFDHGYCVLAFEPDAVDGAHDDGIDCQAVHQDIEMGMLLTDIQHRTSGAVRYRIHVNDISTAVVDAERITVPA